MPKGECNFAALLHSAKCEGTLDTYLLNLITNFEIFSGTTFDIGVPFTYNLPNSTANLVYSGRKIEDEHSAVFEMVEDLLNK